MTTPVGFDALKAILQRRATQLPDHRTKGPNTRYSIQNAAWGAFGLFFTQSPSFRDYQRHLHKPRGKTMPAPYLALQRFPVTIRDATGWIP